MVSKNRYLYRIIDLIFMKRKYSQTKNKKLQELYNKIGPRLTVWWTYGLLVVGILLSLSLFRNVSTIISADKTIAETKERLENLKRENKELSDQVDKVKSPGFRESEARDKLGLAKPGETVLVLPEADIIRKVSPVEVDTSYDSLPIPNWQKWLKLFL